MNRSARFLDPVSWLQNNILLFGIETVFRRYYSVYRATVIDVSDPDQDGRVRAICPALGHTVESNVPLDFWAKPIFPGLGYGKVGRGHGMFWPPALGDTIFMMFEHGLPETPVYIGGMMRRGGTASVFKSETAQKRGFNTPAGHYIVFDDSEGNLSVTISRGNGSGEPTGSYVSLQKDGGVVVSNDEGGMVLLGADGSSTLIAPDGSLASVGNGAVTLANKNGTALSLDGDNVQIVAKGDVIVTCGGQFYSDSATVALGHGAVQPALRGNDVAAWLASHIHTSAAPASPTSPPTVPPIVPNNGLSVKVLIA